MGFISGILCVQYASKRRRVRKIRRPIVKDLILDLCIGLAWALLVMAIVLISVGHTTRFIYAAF